MNKSPWWQSSTGSGLALRVQSFVLATVVPVLVAVLKAIGVEVDVVPIVGGLLEVFAIGLFLYGLARRNFNKKNSLGKFAK